MSLQWMHTNAPCLYLSTLQGRQSSMHSRGQYMAQHGTAWHGMAWHMSLCRASLLCCAVLCCAVRKTACVHECVR